ncbi:hypothetical protein BDM02DRAFT_1425153 [Thelephora ganbajun]|uniref:Uncharacterized protein n=1 Tax=Thelephora ganbajun TaxID=370292 RepID=A0ACB6ZL79_THEGA|nr:hypothetical protein BDM02DRAFT_1425153 [Thelephora ganbajun]
MGRKVCISSASRISPHREDRTSQLIMDSNETICVHLAGRPLSNAYTAVIERANDAMERAAANINFRENQEKGCRGHFPAISVGISSGTGNSRPHMLHVYEDQVSILQELLENKDMLRISGYANSAFKEFAPDLYNIYRTQMDEVTKGDEKLMTPYSNSAFACTAFNFGPRAVLSPHKDHLNLLYGCCSITALGNFDHKAGGHLVLPDLKLAIEFPAGSTVLILSASLTHYNAPVASEETRRSITQFCNAKPRKGVSNGQQPNENH